MGCQSHNISLCALAQYGGIYRYSSDCPTLSRTFRPSITKFIPRIFPQGKVTTSHYDILYYRQDPTHTAHASSGRGALLHGLNCTRASPCSEGEEVLWPSWGLHLVSPERRGPNRPPYGRRPWSVRQGLWMRSSSMQRKVDVVERRVACSPSPQQWAINNPQYQ
jgi:hypothetical protein